MCAFTAIQLTAMDPDLNGVSNGVDISYLMNVVAMKYRFLKTFSGGMPLYLTVDVRDTASSHFTLFGTQGR